MILVEELQNFRADEDGSVTVDQVVFTADIVGLDLAEMALVSSVGTSLNTKISSYLAAQTIATH